MGNLGAAGDPREVYRRYSHPEDYAEPEPMTVAQPWTPRGDTVVTQAFSAIEKVRDLHRDYVGKVQNNDDLTDEARKDAIVAFASAPEARYLEGVKAAVDQRVELAQNEYQQQLAGLSQDGDTAQELRNSRTWERERRKLDAAESNPLALQLAKQALETADPATLGVLMQEVPSYLQSRNIPTDWIAPVVTQKVPELGEKLDKMARAKQAQQVLDYDIAGLRRGFQSGHPPNFLVDPGKYDPDR